jgi:SNF2 family DNA or RNA helicase
MELFSQLNMLAPAQWSDAKEFGKRYCRKKRPKKARVIVSLASGEVAATTEVPAASSKQGEFSGASHTHELHLLLTDTVMIRRLKKHVLRELPAKQRSVVKVPVMDDDMRDDLAELLAQVRLNEEGARQRKLGKAGRGAMARAVMGARLGGAKRTRMGGAGAAGGVPGGDVEGQEQEEEMREGQEHGEDEQELDREQHQARVNCLMKLFSTSGIAKCPAVLQHVQAFLDDPRTGKLLIFAHHRSVVSKICELLETREQAYIRIDGRTNPSERAGLVTQFQNTPAVRVAVLAITAAGVAITLTAAATVFFAEMFWTPGSLVQAEVCMYFCASLCDVTSLSIV